MPAEPASPRFEDRLAASCRQHARLWLTGLAVILIVTGLRWWWMPGKDAGAYLSIARGIAHGELQRFGEDHLHYAPGYPLLISPLFFFGDRPFLLISLAHVGFTLVLGGCVWRWSRPQVGDAAALVTAAVMLNYNVLFYSWHTLSEAAMMPMLVGSALILHKLIDRRPLRQWLGWAIVGGLLAALMGLVRQQSVFLIAAFVTAMLFQAWRKRLGWSGAAARGLIVAVPMVVVIFATIRYSQYTAERAPQRVPTYAEHIVQTGGTWPEKIAWCAQVRINEFGRLLLPGTRKAYAEPGDWLDVNTLAYGVLTIGLSIGWLRAARRRVDLLVWMAPWYLAFLLIWPFEAATRYMVPLTPVLVVCLWMLIEPLRRHRCSILLLFTVAHFAVTVGLWTRDLQTRRDHRYWPAIDQLARRIDAPGGIAVADLDDTRLQMLRLALDRSVVDRGQWPQPPRWLIAGPEAAPDGYEPIARAGDMQLFQRR